MTITTVQIRLIADSEADARAAIDELRNYVGSARISLASPHAGRKGGQWLAYGTFQFESGEPPTIVAPPAQPRMPRAARAATGPTTKLAATGKTRKLRKP